MGNSPDPNRPLKRLKYAQQEGDDEHDGLQPIVTLPAVPPVNDDAGPSDEPQIFGNPWSAVRFPSETFSIFTDPPIQEVRRRLLPSRTRPAARPDVPNIELSPRTTQYGDQLPDLQPRPPSLPSSSSESEASDSICLSDDSKKSNTQVALFNSPFEQCEHRVERSFGPRFARPVGGQVNGYVKFNWPTKKSTPKETGLIESRRSSNVTVVSNGSSLASASHSSMPPVYREYSWGPVVTGSLPTSLQERSLTLTTKNPRMVPPHFGAPSKMDVMDRRLWDFYVRNWCPGRSVLNRTNLWLRDFAQMQGNEAIRSAITSLAGVYIYDYVPDERIRERINARFLDANARFRKMLAAPENSQVGKGDEVITMAVILSMQDIVLTEGRRKKPFTPRWLEGFKQGEHFLRITDPGHRFWQPENAQVSELRLSQSIIVGRAVILAQPMMMLPPPETFDPEYESSRFGWLLYGSEKDMYEVHGGCGFSKKLLHLLSQVTYCAARLQQDRDSSIAAMTAEYIFHQIEEMRQWSSESISYDAANDRPRPIDWVRSLPDNFILASDGAMTDITAESWRIAAAIYMQCRVFRLPRNHPEVLSNMDDLAKCISIMPTSGPQFTAQAPLLPVFLLGLLAITEHHLSVSQGWFDAVVQTPVRSSVPPLYEALKRIRAWFETELEPPENPESLHKTIGRRQAWWERLVKKVQEREPETLCLT